MELFDKVKGFSYTSYELKGQCKPYLETGDPLWILDFDGAIASSFYLDLHIKAQMVLKVKCQHHQLLRQQSIIKMFRVI